MKILRGLVHHGKHILKCEFARPLACSGSSDFSRDHQQCQKKETADLFQGCPCTRCLERSNRSISETTSPARLGRENVESSGYSSNAANPPSLIPDVVAVRERRDQGAGVASAIFPVRSG